MSREERLREWQLQKEQKRQQDVLARPGPCKEVTPSAANVRGNQQKGVVPPKKARTTPPVTPSSSSRGSTTTTTTATGLSSTTGKRDAAFTQSSGDEHAPMTVSEEAVVAPMEGVDVMCLGIVEANESAVADDDTASTIEQRSNASFGEEVNHLAEDVEDRGRYSHNNNNNNAYGTQPEMMILPISSPSHAAHPTEGSDGGSTDGGDQSQQQDTTTSGNTNANTSSSSSSATTTTAAAANTTTTTTSSSSQHQKRKNRADDEQEEEDDEPLHPSQASEDSTVRTIESRKSSLVGGSASAGVTEGRIADDPLYQEPLVIALIETLQQVENEKNQKDVEIVSLTERIRSQDSQILQLRGLARIGAAEDAEKQFRIAESEVRRLQGEKRALQGELGAANASCDEMMQKCQNMEAQFTEETEQLLAKLAEANRKTEEMKEELEKSKTWQADFDKEIEAMKQQYLAALQDAAAQIAQLKSELQGGGANTTSTAPVTPVQQQQQQQQPTRHTIEPIAEEDGQEDEE